jgi:hypothetical protein
MKTNELTGRALNWAVAQAQGVPVEFSEYCEDALVVVVPEDDIEYDNDGYPVLQFYNPAKDWSDGGPIIEREGISVLYRTGVRMTANINGQYEQSVGHRHKGNIGLLVAMRCYVASKLGDDIDIPAELTKE